MNDPWIWEKYFYMHQISAKLQMFRETNEKQTIPATLSLWTKNPFKVKIFSVQLSLSFGELKSLLDLVRMRILKNDKES